MPKNSNSALLIALIFANILAWFSFLSIVFFSNPKDAGMFGAVVLVVSFIVGLISLAFLLWWLTILRKK